jgi:hypothetical protein
MTPINRVANNLRRAKSYIDTPEKWLQGRFEDGTGRMCMANAMSMAMFGENFTSLAPRGTTKFWASAEVEALGDAASDIMDVAPYEYQGRPDICQINNRSTHGQIMRVFDLAIEHAEAQSPQRGDRGVA